MLLTVYGKILNQILKIMFETPISALLVFLIIVYSTLVSLASPSHFPFLAGNRIEKGGLATRATCRFTFVGGVSLNEKHLTLTQYKQYVYRGITRGPLRV